VRLHAGTGIVAIVGFLLTSTTLFLLPSWHAPDWLRRPLHDDAYYFLVIARNVAHGHGVTVAGVWVNGFQPLHLLPCLLAGSLAGWSLVDTPAVLTALDFVLHNLGGVLLLWHIGARSGWSGAATAFCALVWLFHPYGQRAALNGMETSLALVAWLVVGLAWTTRQATARSLPLAFALGSAFWARNDAVVLSVSCGLLMLGSIPGGDAATRRSGLRRLAGIAAVVFLVACPWLAFNLAISRSWIPQSGLAERAGGLYDLGRGLQLGESVAAMARNLSPIPFPLSRIEFPLRVVAALPVVMAVAAIGGWVWLRWRQARDLLTFYSVAIGLLWAVYALSFGASHMLTRWLAPAVVLSVIVFGHLLGSLWQRQGLARLTACGLITAVVAGRFVTAVADARMPQPTNTWSMLRYAQTTALPEPIGSFQSGLLAWVLPSVTNLDGKVNPDALAAIRQKRLAAWIAESGVRSVIDQNLFGYENDPLVQAAFTVDRPAPGLIVLRRR
jgi:hypothetical protein